MKRITGWPQIWLGLVFSWAGLVGWSEVIGALTVPGLLLYAGTIFWVVGYDTIYALQDREDDALIGIGSSALSMGRHVRAGLACAMRSRSRCGPGRSGRCVPSGWRWSRWRRWLRIWYGRSARLGKMASIRWPNSGRTDLPDC